MSEKKQILYTDDEEINLKLFEFNFSKKYDVITAINPQEGLDCLKVMPNIKVVISDMKMPGMNGL
jgi:CheY-like chemotaxis protein